MKKKQKKSENGVKIVVDIPPIPAERLEPFLDFLADLLAKEYIKEMEEKNISNEGEIDKTR